MYSGLKYATVKRAEIRLYGSFLATGKGHGIRFAVVAGLLGLTCDPVAKKLLEE